MKTMIFEATWHAQLSLSSCPFWLSLWRARERARASPFSSRFVQMQSSDMLASAAERPGAPTPSAAAADAAKGRQNHGNDDDDDDRTIAAALSGRFVLSAEEASCFFFRGGFDAPERVQMDLVCNASERDTKGYSGGRGPIRKRKKQNQNKKTSSLSTSSSSSSSSKTLQASSLASALRLPSVAALLPKLVASASGAARVPTSRYRVGAAPVALTPPHPPPNPHPKGHAGPCLLPPQAGVALPGHADTLGRAISGLSLLSGHVCARGPLLASPSPLFRPPFSSRPWMHRVPPAPFARAVPAHRGGSCPGAHHARPPCRPLRLPGGA